MWRLAGRPAWLPVGSGGCAGFQPAPGRALGWCGAGSRVRRRVGSFPPASSWPDHPGRAAGDMRGRRFGWKWGLLVGAPVAALLWSALPSAARRRLRHAGFGGHAPSIRSSRWYGREAANRMTAAEGCPLPPPLGFSAGRCPACLRLLRCGWRVLAHLTKNQKTLDQDSDDI